MPKPQAGETPALPALFKHPLYELTHGAVLWDTRSTGRVIITKAFIVILGEAKNLRPFADAQGDRGGRSVEANLTAQGYLLAS